MPQQNGECAYCHCSLYDEAMADKSLHIDHIIPRAHGGLDSLSNLCLTCAYCNVAKKTKSKQEFREWLKPYSEGRIRKKDLSKYYKFQSLADYFKSIGIPSEIDIEKRIKIEYHDIILRLQELEEAYQEIRDMLSSNKVEEVPV